MKLYQTILLLLVTTLSLGQNNRSKEPATFLDSAFISANTMNYINSEEIESVNIIKNDTIINNNSYAGQIHNNF